MKVSLKRNGRIAADRKLVGGWLRNSFGYYHATVNGRVVTGLSRENLISNIAKVAALREVGGALSANTNPGGNDDDIHASQADNLESRCV